MKKIFVLPPSENWICDRQVNEYRQFHQNCVDSPYSADIIWLMANWAWNKVPYDLLKTKTVVTTIHHIVPEKFNNAAKLDFFACDNITNAYIVPNERTEKFVKNLTSKPVHLIPYWGNAELWHKNVVTKMQIRDYFKLPLDKTLYGSFQRDSEGSDTSLPKLEKGPDLLADFLEKKYIQDKNIHVVLAGWRRQYLMKRLDNASIPYSYFELPSEKNLNLLYQSLDCYPVTARYEGGPQAFIECALLGIPMISTPVGMAEQVLSNNAINDDILLATPEIPHLDSNTIMPAGFEKYDRLFETLAPSELATEILQGMCEAARAQAQSHLTAGRAVHGMRDSKITKVEPDK